MRFRSRCFVISLYLCFCLAGCKSSGPGGSDLSQLDHSMDLGLNDVSILFPLDLLPGLGDRLPLITDQPEPNRFAPSQPALPLDGEAFVPPAIKPFVEGEHLKDFTSLRVTALRIDPCANILGLVDLKSCVPQIRLIWQTLNLDGPHFRGTADTGLHAVYRLDPADIKAIIVTLRALHAAAPLDKRKLPLQSHPVIAAEALDGPYLAGVLGLIHRYVRASRLTHFAFMRRLNETFPSWDMAQFSWSDATVTPQLIPTTSPEAFVQRFKANTPVLSVNPPSRTAPKLSPIVLPPGVSHPLSAEERRLQPLQSALAIENPNLHNPLNIDCGSCHRTAALYGQRESAQKEGRLLATPEAYRSARWPLQASVSLDPFSLHMFSFFLAKPEITPRVVNETAHVLDFIAEHY